MSRVTAARTGLFLMGLSLVACASPLRGAEAADVSDEVGTVVLLDHNLSQWERWMGVPHATVKDLPAGTYQSDDVHRGEAMGLGNDPKGVFCVIEEDGEPVLRVSGEVYGGLTTKASFDSYHLTTQFRWGEQKWAPRLDKKRDSGILYHCHGEHGAFWQVWKACLEFQVQETDLGDFIPLAGPRAKVRGKQVQGKQVIYDPDSDTLLDARGYISCQLEPDAPHGSWNTLDLYVVGSNAIHVVNGEVVMVVQDAVDRDGRPLVSGQIQLQSEAAECYYKGLELTQIADFPAEMRGLVRD